MEKETIMKLTAIFIAVAMLCMVIEGCDKYVGGETYGQKIDRAIEKTNLAVIQIGDKVVFRVDEAGAAMSSAATAISGTASIMTADVGDAAITGSIKADLLKDPDISVMKIDVETHDGVVSLNGLTYDESARARAERLARASKGVMQVNNRLVVKQL
jgi:hyperosmotically inducible periplasmic protein